MSFFREVLESIGINYRTSDDVAEEMADFRARLDGRPPYDYARQVQANKAYKGSLIPFVLQPSAPSYVLAANNKYCTNCGSSNIKNFCGVCGEKQTIDTASISLGA